MSEQALAESCPTISDLSNSIAKQARIFIPQALVLFNSGPAGLKQLNAWLKSVDTRMHNFWRTLRSDRQLMILKILNEDRQLYTYTELRRVIPWPNPKKGGPPLQANQSCTWTMCVPKALAALNVCALYRGLNASSPEQFTYTDGKAAVIWGAYTDAITRMQVSYTRTHVEYNHVPGGIVWESQHSVTTSSQYLAWTAGPPIQWCSLVYLKQPHGRLAHAARPMRAWPRKRAVGFSSAWQ